MDAIALLQQQHREVEQLFEQIKAGAAEGELRRRVLALADALSAHASIEEDSFYPAAKSEETEDLLRESVTEHLGVKRLLVDLLDMDVSDERFDATISVLEEQVKHHVKEEEGDLIPKVRRLLSAEALEELGAQMETDFEDLMASEPRENLADEVDEPAPI
jgi:hemerythrin superfamily protein